MNGLCLYSSAYEFNDRGKVLGLNPEASFAEPIIEAFFAKVQSAYVDACASTVTREVGESIKAQQAHTETVEHYKSLVQESLLGKQGK